MRLQPSAMWKRKVKYIRGREADNQPHKIYLTKFNLGTVYWCLQSKVRVTGYVSQ